MIFERITIKNFRQFAGEQILEFAKDESRNVTVIHGYNGSGKTTLLNAFVWLFYGDFTPDFTDTDLLVNEGEWVKLKEGEELTVSVKGIFLHEGRRYIAERGKVIEKLADGARKVKKDGKIGLHYFNDDGELREIGGPQDAIEQILPKTLYPFFLFNGERIERLAGPQAYEQVENGIKVLLDIELLERAIYHLKGKTADTFRNEVAKHSGNEGREAKEEREELNDELESLNEEKKQDIKNRDSLVSEREKIDEKLRNQPELARLQQERENKEENLAQTKQDLKVIRSDIGKLLSNDGYLPLASSPLEIALSQLDHAYEEGQIPPPLKREFVEELLEHGECICGEPLEEGSTHYEKVKEWKDSASSDDIARLATTMRAEIRRVVNKRSDDFHQKLKKYQARRENLQQRKKKLEERLSEISSQIGDDAPEEDYQALESRRRSIEKKLETEEIKLADLERKITEKEREIREKDKQIKSLRQANEKGKLAQRRLEAVENVAEVLDKIRNLQQQSVRSDLSERLNTVWNDISIKDYKAKLDSEYRLKLTKRIEQEDIPVRGASTGEKQVLSLAFVSSLVRKAEELRSGSSTSSAGLFSGGQYPLIMDSPFGSLEVEYRRQVADWVPKLSPQIVVVVSETQWREEVEEEITPRIGKEWILECHTPKHKEKSIELRGRNYPYVVSSADGFEKTVIKEVEL